MGKEMPEGLKCQKGSRTVGSQLHLVLSHRSVLPVNGAEGSICSTSGNTKKQKKE